MHLQIIVDVEACSMYLAKYTAEDELRSEAVKVQWSKLQPDNCACTVKIQTVRIECPVKDVRESIASG